MLSFERRRTFPGARQVIGKLAFALPKRIETGVVPLQLPLEGVALGLERGDPLPVADDQLVQIALTALERRHPMGEREDPVLGRLLLGGQSLRLRRSRPTQVRRSLFRLVIRH